MSLKIIFVSTFYIYIFMLKSAFIKISEMEHQADEILSPHILIIPIPLQSPVNCMLKLAELLCMADLHVTFLTIDHFHCRLLQYTDIESRFAQYPRFRFETISDGLPKDHCRCDDKFYEMMDAMENVVQPLLKEKLRCGSLSSNSSKALPITCIIAEASIRYALNVAQQIEVPLFCFDTIGPCAVWTYLCLPKLIEAGEVPFKGLSHFVKFVCLWKLLLIL